MTIDANAQSGILLTPIEKFQNVDSGAEAGFQLEVETLASAPPSDASGCVGQNGLGLVDLVHGRVGLVGLLVISVIDGRLLFAAVIVDQRRFRFIISVEHPSELPSLMRIP